MDLRYPTQLCLSKGLWSGPQAAAQHCRELLCPCAGRWYLPFCTYPGKSIRESCAGKVGLQQRTLLRTAGPSTPIQSPHGHFQSKFSRPEGPELKFGLIQEVWWLSSWKMPCTRLTRSSLLYYCFRATRKPILKKKVSSNGKKHSLCQYAAA